MMQTLISVSDYLNGDSSEQFFISMVSDSAVELIVVQDDEDSRRRQHPLLLHVHEQIQSRQQTIAQKETSLESVRSRVLSRIEQINQA